MSAPPIWDKPPTLTITAACRELGISTSLGYELAAAGGFPCRVIKAGRRIVVPTADLDRLLGRVDDRRTDQDAA